MALRTANFFLTEMLGMNPFDFNSLNFTDELNAAGDILISYILEMQVKLLFEGLFCYLMQ